MSKLVYCVFLILIASAAKGQSDQNNWTQLIESPSVESPLDILSITAMASNSKNKLIVVGTYTRYVDFGNTQLSSDSKGEVFVACYSESGNLEWVKDFAFGLSIGTQSLKIDTDNNIIISGQSTQNLILKNDSINQNGLGDVIIMKLDEVGEYMWSYHFGGLNQDIASGLDIDSENNVFVTGTYQNRIIIEDTSYLSYGGTDIFLLKLNTSGKLQWFKSIPSSDSNYSSSIVFNDNSIFLAGSLKGSTWFDSTPVISHVGKNLFVAKYDLYGNFNWANNYDGDGVSNKVDQMIVSDDHLFLTGTTSKDLSIDGSTIFKSGTDNSYGGFIAKISTSSETLWAKRLGCEFNHPNRYFVALDSKGKIYVTGGTTGNQMLIAQYGSNGQLLMTHDFDAINGYKIITGNVIYINSNDSLYVTGNAYPSGKRLTALINVKYSNFNAIADIIPDVTHLEILKNICSIKRPVTPIAYDRCFNTLIGTTPQTFPIKIAGITDITWTYTDSNGNLFTQTQKAIVEPLDNTILLDSISLSATEDGDFYQWIDCSKNLVISGETNRIFRPENNGSYAVRIGFEKCYVTSECYNYYILEIEEDKIVGDLKFYPNPVINEILIESDKNNQTQLDFFDLNGVLVLTKTIKGKVTVKLENLNPGIYTIIASNSKGIRIHRFLKSAM